MLTLIKLFKALNSSQKEYQLSLAFIFGIISGFLPFFSIINLFIVFIVFSINIPIAIYGIFALLFSILGSILDPFFHQFGLFLLENSTLNTLWTSFYNNPVALWFNFNHTITLGSFVTAILLSIPTYFISKIFFKKYRELFHTLFKDKKFLSWLNPYSEEKTTKQPGLIRWWGSGLFVILFTSITLFFILLFDPIVKYTLQYLVSKTGITLNINSLESNLNESNIILKDITIIKDNQAHKIDSILINIDTEHLLNKKIDFTLIDIKNIHLNKQFIKTIQKTTSTKKVVVTERKNKKSAIDNLKLDLPNIDTLLEKEDLKSTKEAKLIKERFDNINAKWKNIYKDKLNEKRFTKIKNDFNQIKSLSKNIKSFENLKQIEKKSKLLKEDINSLKIDIKSYKKEYKNDKLILTKDFKNIKTLPMKDYEYLTSKYTLDQNGALNIVSTYISDDLAGYTKKIIKYYKIIKPYLPNSEEDEAIIRKKGSWIKFKEYNPYPNFTIQKLQANIVSDNSDRFNLTLSHLYSTNITADIKNYKVDMFKLDKKLSLTNNILNIKSNIDITNFNSLNSTSNIDFIKTNFIYKNRNSKANNIIKNILTEVDKFTIDAKIDTNIDHIENMKLSIKSDLDKKLSKGFKKELKKQTLKYKKELKEKLTKKIQSKLGNISDTKFKEYEKFLQNSSLEKIKNELKNKYSKDTIKQKLKNIYKKKLEERKKKEQNELKNKLKNKLKSFF